jgi:hypothetical protein
MEETAKSANLKRKKEDNAKNEILYSFKVQ